MAGIASRAHLAAIAAALVLSATAAWAQFGPGGPGQPVFPGGPGAQGGPPQPGGGRPGLDQRRLPTITGQLMDVTDEHLVIQVLPQRGPDAPGDAPGRGRRGQPAAAAPEEAQDVTVLLNDETRYRILDDGDEEMLAEGLQVIAVGPPPEDGVDEAVMLSQGLCMYAADDEPMRAMPLLMGTLRQLLGDMLGQMLRDRQRERARPRIVFGTIDTVAPFAIKARGLDGTERLVDVELADDARLMIIDECTIDDLAPGQWVTVLPARPEGQFGAAPAELTAEIVLQTPPIERRAAPARPRPGGDPPAQ